MCAVVTEKYIDPFTDFGFKWIFGTEENKSLLISFLNDLLELEDKIEACSIQHFQYKICQKEEIGIMNLKKYILWGY